MVMTVKEITMAQEKRLQYFPISFYSMILGLAGLTIVFLRAETILKLPFKISPALWIFSVSVFGLITVFYVLKMIRYPHEIINEFNHPIKLSFFPTFSISLLLFSVVFLSISPLVSKIFWYTGAIFHLILTFRIISIWIHHDKFDIKHMNPAWFIPAVGNLLVPVAGVEHISPDVCWFFFSIGIVFWIILLVIFINRIIFHSPLPQKLLPTLFILIAPPAIGLVAYVKLVGEIDAFARILYYFSLFMFILLLTQIRLFAKIKFFLSWWAYSFPIAAITISNLLMYHETGLLFYKYMSYILMLVLGLAVLGLLIRTVMEISKKEICVSEDD